ncbi:hypothetical protein ACMU_00315 [Actibacterium mucosum KCTC 23349]|uniref:VacJ lipoprotein n=1 Tax=Actibacterium mucosum KCTC 23349 TaxID=1454373 RepID=A0A037ZLK3_9RHOB|nr:VacJ family lipoprotein [Actibacterium mucosum]KAJ56969.1 hypothetical protein ACMU_00315 [Actibacterium mucosum KCTC 23349]
MLFANSISRIGAKTLIAVSALAALAACTGPRDSTGIFDPYETANREHHETNKQLDTHVAKPVANAYGEVVPNPIRTGVSNFAQNLALPGMVINDLLQLRIDDAASNTSRFLVNSTIGLAGVLDPADAMGVPVRESDFGETLHVWGAREGAYMELPVLGPSTERDAIGKVVDFVISPTRVLLPSDVRTAQTVTGVADAANSRYRFSGTIDGVLYESEDSYAQARLLYLQNRRFQLGQNAGEEIEYTDPYDDPYAE